MARGKVKAFISEAKFDFYSQLNEDKKRKERKSTLESQKRSIHKSGEIPPNIFFL
jgi:hypothetical protein